MSNGPSAIRDDVWDQYTSPPKPSLEEQGKRASIRSSEAGAASSSQSTKRSAALLPGDIAQQNLAIEKARYDLANAQRLAQTLTEGQGRASNFYQRMYASNKVISDLKLPPKGLLSTWSEKFAPDASTYLNSDDQNLARFSVEDFIAASLRLESGAAIGKDEFERQYRIFFPSPNAGPKEIAEKARKRQLAIAGFGSEAGPVGREMADNNLKQFGYLQGAPKGSGLASPEVANGNPERSGLTPMIPGEGYIPPKASENYGGRREIKIPQEAQDEAASYIASQGKNITEEGFAKALTDIFTKYGISEVPTPDSVKAVVNSVRKGGGYGGIEPRVRDLSPSEKVSDYLLKNPVSGAIAGFGYGTTAGLLPEAIGLVDPEAQANAEETMRQAREVNPIIMGGEVVGNIYGAGKVAKAVAPALKFAGASEAAAPVVGDVLFSGTQGAAEAEPGERLKGAAIDAALALAGHAAPSVVSRTFKPRPSPEVSFLREKGVTLTPGQTLGGRAARVEEGLAQVLLGGGDVALAARGKAFDDFNRQFLNEAGSHIGYELPNVRMKPTERMKLMREKFDEAYQQARNQMNFVADNDYLDELNNFKQSLGTDIYSPENAARLQNFFDNEIMRRSVKTTVTGDEYKSLTSLLGKRYRAMVKTGNAELAGG